ncbi:hypothetical protein CNR22_04060 [Sphingobacteriaceae bacterium]|nr:hypothetical protein CNR22_04060 [Sphingobacteriaceae bacterium]
MNLVIVSPNKNAYSETFIHNHVKLLPATIHFFFNGHLPKKYSRDKGLTTHDFVGEKKGYGIPQPDKEASLQSAIAEYLKENKIGLILCEYGPTGVAMLGIARQTNIPLVVHFHGYDAYRNDVLDFYRTGYAGLFKQAKAVISVSRHMYSQLEKLGCATSKLQYLPYGIDTAIFYSAENVSASYTFVACGRLVEKKGPEFTIRAFAEVIKKLPQATMAMVGDGELLGACKELAEELEIGASIDFTGALCQEQIADIYRRSLVFVQHSLTSGNNDSEGTPLAILESAACGLPAVSTQHGGIVDVVKEGITGFLVNEKDTGAMTEKMLLLAEQPELAKRMGSNASAFVHAHYTITSYTEKLWQIMQQSAIKDR